MPPSPASGHAATLRTLRTVHADLNTARTPADVTSLLSQAVLILAFQAARGGLDSNFAEMLTEATRICDHATDTVRRMSGVSGGRGCRRQ